MLRCSRRARTWLAGNSGRTVARGEAQSACRFVQWPVPRTVRDFPVSVEQTPGRPRRNAPPVATVNGIWTSAQIDAGLRVARQQEKTFVPSPGQFVAWCRAEECAAVGLPDQAEPMDLFYRYCRTRGSYLDAESFPWPGKIDGKNTRKSSANYWIVTTLYQQMSASGLSDAEVRRKAGEEQAAMALRIRRGEEIPEPKKQLPKLGGKPLTQAQQLAKIREIQSKHGFKGRA